MGTPQFDPAILRDQARAMHQPVQQIQSVFSGVSAKDIQGLSATKRQEVYDTLREPIQDAAALLQLGGKLGLPDVPGSFLGGQSTRDKR